MTDSESLKDTYNVNFIRADTYVYLNTKNHLHGTDGVHINDDRRKNIRETYETASQ